MPIVRYWIPNLKIIQPKSLQLELEDGLRAYLDDLKTQDTMHSA
jgi:hypothetical protein